MNTVNQLLIQFSGTSESWLIEALIDKLQPVFTEKYIFEYREKWITKLIFNFLDYRDLNAKNKMNKFFNQTPFSKCGFLDWNFDEGNQVGRYREKREWISSFISSESTFRTSWNIRILIQQGSNIMILSSNEWVKFSTDSLLGEIKPVVLENHEFEYRDETLLVAATASLKY